MALGSSLCECPFQMRYIFVEDGLSDYSTGAADPWYWISGLSFPALFVAPLVRLASRS